MPPVLCTGKEAAVNFQLILHFLERIVPVSSFFELYHIIWEQIKKLNTTFPRYKHIQNVILCSEELIKTTTKKVKRQEEMKLICKK